MANPDMTEWDLCPQRYFRAGSRFVGKRALSKNDRIVLEK